MTGKALHNFVVELIETEANNRYSNERDIRQLLVKKTAWPERSLSDAFRFNTGSTLAAYIKDRKINAAYKCLVSGSGERKALIEQAQEFSGLSEYNSLSREFKRRFAMTPTEAYKKKDKAKIAPPLTWELISGILPQQSNLFAVGPVNATTAVPNKTIFESAQIEYQSLLEVLDLSSYYGLPPLFSEFAFELSSKTGRPLKETFEYADSLRAYGNYDMCEEDDDEEYKRLTPGERLRLTGNDPYYQFMFFECNLPPEDADEIEDRMPWEANVIVLLDPDEIRAFAEVLDTGLGFKFFQKAYRYYKDNATEQYDEFCYEKYIDLLDCDIPIQIAFELAQEEALIMSSIDDIGFGFDEDFYSPMDFSDEKWILRETVWNEPRFDRDDDGDDDDDNSWDLY